MVNVSHYSDDRRPRHEVFFLIIKIFYRCFFCDLFVCLFIDRTDNYVDSEFLCKHFQSGFIDILILCRHDAELHQRHDDLRNGHFHLLAESRDSDRNIYFECSFWKYYFFLFFYMLFLGVFLSFLSLKRLALHFVELVISVIMLAVALVRILSAMLVVS